MVGLLALGAIEVMCRGIHAILHVSEQGKILKCLNVPLLCVWRAPKCAHVMY